ncbi:MAG TPA: SURF1 family protein [Sphingomicrobium sp.]
MIRRVPIVATIVVIIAVALLVGLGVWQLQRAKWKEGLVAGYARAEKLPPVTWPTVPLKSVEPLLFRHATGICLRPVGKRVQAGENLAGEPGYVHILDCQTGAEGPGMSVEVGWSRDPNAKIAWAGGLVSGLIVPDRRSRIRLIAASAPPGLMTSAPPPPTGEISPGRHRGYAATWFSLAAIALIIYGLALRKRLREERPKE